VLEAIAELGGNTPGNASKVAAKLNIKLKGIQLFLASQEKPAGTAPNGAGATTLPDDIGANGEVEHASPLPTSATATSVSQQTAAQPPARRGRQSKNAHASPAAAAPKTPALTPEDVVAIGELTIDLVAKGKTLAEHHEDIRAEAEILRKLGFTI
jgi:hypothetical protein